MTSGNTSPASWDRSGRSGYSRTGSVSSLGNRNSYFENEALLGRSTGANRDDAEWPHLRRTRYAWLPPSSPFPSLPVGVSVPCN